MPFLDGNIEITNESAKSWRLMKPLVYKGKTQTFTIPKNFVTDFASVPQFMYWFIPSYGLWTLAAILHDWLCVCLASWHKVDRTNTLSIHNSYSGQGSFEIIHPPANSRDTDGLFRRVMRELGVPFVRRWVMWTGVRWGAVFNPARREGVYKDLPLMLLWSILVLPVILPATLFIWLGLAIDYIVNLCLRWVT